MVSGVTTNKIITQQFVNELARVEPEALSAVFHSTQELLQAQKALIKGLEAHNYSLYLDSLMDSRRVWLIRPLTQITRRYFGAKPISFNYNTLYNLFFNALRLSPPIEVNKERGATDELISRLKKARIGLSLEQEQLSRFKDRLYLSMAIYKPESVLNLVHASLAEEALSSDNVLVYHGQSQRNSFYSNVVAALNKLEGYPKNSAPFRPPRALSKIENFKEFKEKVIDGHGDDFNDNEHANLDLISVSANLAEITPNECAAYYMDKNSNISDSYSLSMRFRELFTMYGADPAQVEILAAEALKLAEQKHSEASTGVLYVIAIPKKLIYDDEAYNRRFIYLSKRFGLVKEASKEEVVQMLEEHRSEQYRLLVAPMMRSGLVKTMQITSLSRAKQKEYKRNAERLASAVLAIGK